jgi:hypothetical protein
LRGSASHHDEFTRRCYLGEGPSNMRPAHKVAGIHRPQVRERTRHWHKRRCMMELG